MHHVITVIAVRLSLNFVECRTAVVICMDFTRRDASASAECYRSSIAVNSLCISNRQLLPRQRDAVGVMHHRPATTRHS